MILYLRQKFLTKYTWVSMTSFVEKNILIGMVRRIVYRTSSREIRFIHRPFRYATMSGTYCRMCIVISGGVCFQNPPSRRSNLEPAKRSPDLVGYLHFLRTDPVSSIRSRASFRYRHMLCVESTCVAVVSAKLMSSMSCSDIDHRRYLYLSAQKFCN
jgi:hypothetical protein